MHIDLNYRNITNTRFIQVNQLPQIDSQLIAKLTVDNSIDEVSLVRNNQDNDFNNNNPIKIKNITLNTQAVNDNQVITKAYVDQFHQENERSRRFLGIDFYEESTELLKNNQDNDLNDKKLLNINSVTVNNNPTDDNQVSNKKYFDDELNKTTIVRFNQTLEKYLKVYVGNNRVNLTKYDKIQLTDTTIIKSGDSGGYLLPSWLLFSNDKNKNGKITNFIRATKTTSPTSKSGATFLPRIGNTFLYIETSGFNHGNNIFFSFE